MPLNQPIVCPLMVGRTELRASFEAICREVARGAGKCILISGEAGIGKSRLAAGFAEACSANGWVVLQGNCYQPDRNLPYSAINDLVRRHLAGLSSAERANVLSTADPQVQRALPELASDFAGEVPEPRVPDHEKQGLFRALSNLVWDLMSGRPGLVIVEDVHWSDEATLDFLLNLVRGVSTRPCVIAITYRDDEVMNQLADFLAEVDRSRLATELGIEPLSLEEVEEMLRAIFAVDRPLRRDFVADLYALTEGNPFFVEEVLRSLHSEGVARPWERGAADIIRVPRTVRGSVRRRFAELGAEARSVAQVAAVIGRQFGFATLSRVTGLADDQLMDRIKDLIAAQLVVEESAERFGFRHALTREAIYTEMLARERQALHAAIGEALEQGYTDDLAAHAADLGYHYFEARDWVKALEYGTIAGETSDRIWAPRSAVEHYSRALVAARALDRPAPALLLARARAYDSIGDFERSLADREQALTDARAVSDRETEWQALTDLGSLWTSRNYEKAGGYYREAALLAERMGDQRPIAYSLNHVGNWYCNTERPEEALACHRRALQIFEALGDRRGVATTLDLIGIASYMGCDLVGGLRAYRQAAELFRQSNDRAALASCLAALTMYGRSNHQTQTLVPAQFTREEALACSEEALNTAREIGLRSGESFVLWNRSDLLASQGSYAEALKAGHDGLAIAEEISHLQWVVGAACFIGPIYRDLFCLEKSRAVLEKSRLAALETGSMHWIRTTSAELSMTLTASGRFGEAEALLEECLGPETPARTIAERLAWCARAEHALALGDFERALAAVERLQRDTLNPELGPPGVEISLLRGLALCGCGRAVEAEAVLIGGRDNAALEGSLPRLWRLEAALGRLFQARGAHAEADAAFRRAQSAIARIAPQVPGDLRQTFLAGAARFMPHPRRVQGNTLTPREVTVAGLIARGLSNRAIADELVIGERTVETHVGSILSKLSFQSRAQVAVWAVGNGLAVVEQA